jgi:hypothetical protein
VIKIKFRIMSSRRGRERPVVNASMEEEMRQLHPRLDAMDIAQRLTLEVGDVMEDESENVKEEEVVGE